MTTKPALDRINEATRPCCWGMVSSSRDLRGYAPGRSPPANLLESSTIMGAFSCGSRCPEYGGRWERYL